MEDGLAATSTRRRVPMFTLADSMKMIQVAEGLPKTDPRYLQMQEAILGDYILTDDQAKVELERRASGKHGLDDPRGTNYLGLPGGKLPGHPTFSTESPHYIQGLAAAEAGKWMPIGGNEWSYQPHQAQFDRDPNYMDKLMNYFRQEKGRGINQINMPDGKVIR